LKTGFTGEAVNYVLDDYSKDFVILKSEDGDFVKEFVFLPETYEVLIKDRTFLVLLEKLLLRYIEQRVGRWT
jgi:hypothetical protein